MTEEVLTLALEALELAHPRFGIGTEKHKQAITAIKEALAQPTPAEYAMGYAEGFNDGCKPKPEQEPMANGKLKVTLQDTPTEIELAQYKRMFEAACSALGAIGEALGVDEDEGGSEPILFAIEELKAQLKEPKPCPTCEALARTVMLDQTAHDTPQQRTWVGLDDEEIKDAGRFSYCRGGTSEKLYHIMWNSQPSACIGWSREELIAFTKAVEAKYQEKNQ